MAGAENGTELGDRETETGRRAAKIEDLLDIGIRVRRAAGFR